MRMRIWLGIALFSVLVLAGGAVAAAADQTASGKAPGTTTPSRQTTTTTHPPRPTTTTTTIVSRTTTTTAAPTTTTTAATTTTTTTTVPATTTTTTPPAPTTAPAPPPAPPEQQCGLIAWRGDGTLHPGVDPAYQNPVPDAGLLNVYGWGFLPGEQVDLLRDGSAVASVEAPLADQTGKFLANRINTGGYMELLEELPLPQKVGAQGAECTAVVPFPEPQCGLIAWWSDGTLNPAVDPAYQNPSTDAGHLNLYGWGFLPGESLTLLREGSPIPVAGDGPPYADQFGKFLANKPNTGGQMGWLEGNPDNQGPGIGAQGQICTAFAAYAAQAPEGMDAAFESSPIPWWVIVLGTLIGAGTVAAAIFVWPKIRRA